MFTLGYNLHTLWNKLPFLSVETVESAIDFEQPDYCKYYLNATSKAGLKKRCPDNKKRKLPNFNLSPWQYLADL